MPSIWKILWAPAAVVLSHSFIATFIGHPPVLDLFMHPFGGLAIAYATDLAVPRLAPRIGHLTNLGRSIFVLGVAFVVANLWEYAEFFADLLMDSKIQTSIAETMFDLLLGTGAAALFVVGTYFVRGNETVET